MNGLLLPSGSRPAIKGDTRAEPNPPHSSISPLSTSPATLAQRTMTLDASRGDRAAAHQHSPPDRLSASPPKPLRGGSGTRSATSLAFIPRTSRTSAGIRKPIAKCSEFELIDMLDRNERILATPLPPIGPGPASAIVADPNLEVRLEAQHRARERLRRETDDIKRELIAKRGVRQINENMARWQISEQASPSTVSKEALAEAMDRLSVQSGPSGSTARAGSSPVFDDSFAWMRDTLGVKRRLADETHNTIPGSRVQQMSYEQSVALQSAALLAEMERNRRVDEVRPSGSRERSTNGLPAGTAHRLGRKSISSASLAVRKGSSSQGVGRLGPCPGFGLPRRPSGSAGPAVLDEDEDSTSLKAEQSDDEQVKLEEDPDSLDRDEQRRTVSPSDLFADDGPDLCGGGDIDEMAFDDDWES